MARADITVEQMREAFLYDGETGFLTCRVARKTKQPGMRAEFDVNGGYFGVKIGGCVFAAHRAAWLIVNGEWPSGPLDHINGDKQDNRMQNLRIVDAALNSQNQRRAHVDNASGLMGVWRHKKSGGFYASLTSQGTTKHLGRFPSAEEAHKAYLEAKRSLHEGCTI